MANEAVRLDLIINAGSNETWVFTCLQDDGVTPEPLEGVTAVLKLREGLNTEPFLTLTTENGKLIINEQAGTITASFTAEETSALRLPSAVYGFKLLYPDGSIPPFLYGSVKINPDYAR